MRISKFLSTPSARRATGNSSNAALRFVHFYPRPPRGGRPSKRGSPERALKISIHALREEGDPCAGHVAFPPTYFYPRPPRGGRRSRRRACKASCHISIHALREEGDPRRPRLPQHIKEFLSTPSARRATRHGAFFAHIPVYFYPRPPRGGRHTCAG